MTDHTPSPATDGLRARLIETLDVLAAMRAKNDDVRFGADVVIKRIRADLALLADPAPEAARCKCGHPRSDHVGGVATCQERDRSLPCGCTNFTPRAPADLPVAAGVRTEDEEIDALRFAVAWWAAKWAEARAVLAMVADRIDEFTYDEFSTLFDDEPNDHLGETYAPAPVVSAGDEGVGLRDTIASSLNIVGPLRHIFGAHSTSKELLDALEVLLDQEIDVLAELLAVRVAEAGARALEEAEQRLVAIQNACNKTGDYNGGLSGAIAVIRELRADQ